MLDINILLQCLQVCVGATTVRRWSRVVAALLAMTGRVTMLGLARWGGEGASYRTVQRFFYTAIPWPEVMWLFVRQHLLCPHDVYLLAGDEVVVTKAGKKTFGLDRFFSGVLRKPVPSVAFFALALVSTQQRRAFPLRLEQVVRTEAEKAVRHRQTGVKSAPVAAAPGKPGRPKGSKTKNQAEVSLPPELQRIQQLVKQQLQVIGGRVVLTYLALDGHFGHNNALQMTRQCELHLISKLRADAALYMRYDGPYGGRGPRRKYGDKLDYRHLPERYLKQTSIEDDIETRLYQAQLLHKEFSQPLNVVILVKTNLKTNAWAHVILFSSDLELAADQLVEYYRLRFQIEFNFRDAKQYWGLEDFMNVTQRAVTNFANLSLFMVNLVYVLLGDFQRSDPDFSVLDLKASCRAYTYVTETLKLLPEKPDEVLVAQIVQQMASLGRIHSPTPSGLAA